MDRRVRLWQHSGADLRHREKVYGELRKHKQWSAALDKAIKVVDGGGIVVILGDRGNGKTQAGVELIRQCCLLARPARYVRCREIGMRLREAYDRFATVTEADVMGEFVTPHLLVIDECQERPDKDWEIRSLTLILDKRYAAMVPTVFIANCTAQQFSKLMGTSVTDRIKEGGGVIRFTWPSFRGK